MNKNILIIIISIIFSVSLGLSSVSLSKVYDNHGVTYLKSTHSPYTGKIDASYTNGKQQLEFNLKDGQSDGLQTTWYDNGQKQTETS
jgi:antitoxin component YwqK of YwqJK toxin-antitoxin module